MSCERGNLGRSASIVDVFNTEVPIDETLPALKLSRRNSLPFVTGLRFPDNILLVNGLFIVKGPVG